MEIFLSNYNEMLRYERDMDQLRALALWITLYKRDPPISSLPQPTEYVFELIKFYSQDFASEIVDNGHISSDALGRFHSSLFSVNNILGITQEDITRASEQQRYRNSGFWEMRRVIGQFGDVAEAAIKDRVTHIITAAVSGCIIGEYLGLIMSKKFQHPLPVDHMVFSRSGIQPVNGYLPENLSLSGEHILIADDAVMETYTSRVMIAKIKEMNPQAIISLMTIDIDPDTKKSGYLDQFAHVYTFDE
ncbi:MAG: hypothetical protein UX08_C0012G0031 [Candidatus Collierbacteria bacterium GW2011_GWB1_45_35]|nr:MAG: hypothetical protein UX08_C0012G0031 [Candidatus Collierbacteria bacterium GW2011_GWB1_45_35]HCX25915.1 hypothetical protein [Candidatus Collierbacteria bacterium]